MSVNRKAFFAVAIDQRQHTKFAPSLSASLNFDFCRLYSLSLYEKTLTILCPLFRELVTYAPGATGNLATEDLVYMLRGMSIEIGIDLPRLWEAGQVAAKRLSEETCLARFTRQA